MKAQEILHEDAPWVPIAYVKPPLGIQENGVGLRSEPDKQRAVQHRLNLRRPVGR